MNNSLQRPTLNINSLHQVHDNRISVKLSTFNKILNFCHQKIEKYNKDYKKMECLYIPPVSIIGCPLYKSDEIICYLIENLRNDGFTAYWDTMKNSIYISWYKPLLSENVSETNIERDGLSSMKIVSVPQENSSGPEKKSKTKKINKPIQHMALVNYGGDANEIIPISL